MYIAIHPSFNENEIVLKYSQTERVPCADEIQHKYFRQVLRDYNIRGVEITSCADVPSGTGLGSSSSFTVCLLTALCAYKGINMNKYMIAEESCKIEIEKLGEPIGKQDQYAAAFGGLNFIEFKKDGSVTVEPVLLSAKSFEKLENNLLMFYTGDVRCASCILKEQGKDVTSGDKEQAMIKICELTRKLKLEFEKDNIDAIGEILHESWLQKKKLSNKITNPDIDVWYGKAMKAGALGGKLLGAGDGGFLLFYVPQDRQLALRKTLAELKELKFGIDTHGTTIIYSKNGETQ